MRARDGSGRTTSPGKDEIGLGGSLYFSAAVWPASRFCVFYSLGDHLPPLSHRSGGDMSPRRLPWRRVDCARRLTSALECHAVAVASGVCDVAAGKTRLALRHLSAGMRRSPTTKRGAQRAAAPRR